MYAAWRSSRVRMCLMLPTRKASYSGRLVSPQSPNTISTPCARSISTTACAPFMVVARVSTGLFKAAVILARMNVADRQKPKPGELFVDHVSHFVADLDAAARALEDLRMKVTPTSVQTTADGPVGASNRCAMLEEGYIELLSPTHDTPSAQRLRAYMGKYAGVHLAC